MKKKFRFLSLMLSLLLLCATAFPAGAACYYPEDWTAGLPTRNAELRSQVIGSATYSVTVTPLGHSSSRWEVYEGISGWHSGNTDTSFEAYIEDGEVTLYASGDFSDAYYNGLNTVRSQTSAVGSVTNQGEYFEIYFPAEGVPLQYQMFVGCVYGSVVGTVTGNGVNHSETINFMPYANSTFYFLDY